MIIILSICFLGFLISMAARIFGEDFFRGWRVLPALSVFVFALCLLAFFWQRDGMNPPQLVEALSWTMGGSPLRLQLDAGLGVIVLLILAVGLAISVYCSAYFHKFREDEKFFPAFLLFTFSMLGLVVSDHSLILFLFWELTSISSFYLIGFYSQNAEARKAALQALLVTGVGGLAMLLGFIMLQRVTGSLYLSEWVQQGFKIAQSNEGLLALFFVSLGALTKSAQFPFHFWLPGAMAAPTPISAYLHSATMVKAGVILFYKMLGIFSIAPWFPFAFSLLGSLTILISFIRLFSTSDFKLTLAYTTLISLGVLNLSLWVGGQAGVLFCLLLISHGLYKAAFFLGLGVVDHQAGSRDVFELFGLRKKMPATLTVFVLSFLALIGVPGSLSALGKEGLFLLSPNVWPAFIGVSVVSGVVASAIYTIFFAQSPRRVSEFRACSEGSVVLWAPPMALAVLGFFMPLLFQRWGLSLEFSNSFSGRGYLSWASWGVGLVCGFVFFIFFNSVRLRFYARGTQWLNKGLTWFMDELAVKSRSILQGAKVSTHLKIVFAFWLGFNIFVLLKSPSLLKGKNLLVLLEDFNPWMELSLILLTALGCFLIVKSKRLLEGILAASLVGLVVVFIFARGSAPDLALTQIGVESLSLVFVLLFLKLVPTESWRVDRLAERQLDGIFAVLAGFLMAGLTLFQVFRVPSQLVNYFNEVAPTLGHGINVVNVILVDFRALDTLGEITVLVIAALCTSFSVQKILMTQGKELKSTSNDGLFNFNKPNLKIYGPILVGLLGALAIYFYLRGHNAPGGGFIGGLLAGVAVLLVLLLPQLKLKIGPNFFVFVLALGLLLAFFSGVLAFITHQQFLTGVWVNGVGTPMLFDLGVMLIVIGLIGHVSKIVFATKEVT